MELAGQLFWVGLVVALAAGAAWWLRRGGAGRLAMRSARRRRLELVERLALGPQHSLCLVRSGEEELLVALHPGGCTLLEAGAARRPAAARGAGL
jgi:flagellar biogenesis protein FliO